MAPRVSLADLKIVAGRGAAVEAAPAAAGHAVEVPFQPPAASDASQEQTDVESVCGVEPPGRWLSQYQKAQLQRFAGGGKLLIVGPSCFGLKCAGVTVLVGGLRVLAPMFGRLNRWVFTHRPRHASTRLLREPLRYGHGVDRQPLSRRPALRACRHSANLRWSGSRVDLVFWLNSQLRALAEVLCPNDGSARFVALISCGLSKGDEP